jgi:hypothetical protein
MAADSSKDLTGKKIQETYTRVLHTDGNKIYDGTGSVVLESVELSSLQTMNNNTIENGDWTYVANMDQHVDSRSTPTFDGLVVQADGIQSLADISASGTVSGIQINTNKIVDVDDTSTSIDFTYGEQVHHWVKGKSYIRLRDTAQDVVRINEGSADIDFEVRGDNHLLLKTDAVDNYTEISGSLRVTGLGHISASGKISASEIHLPFGGDIIWDGDVNTRIETSGEPEDLNIYADRHIRLFADGNVEFGNGPDIRFNQTDNVFNMVVQEQFGNPGVSLATNQITASGIISSSATTGENILGTDLTVYGRIRTIGSEVSINTGSIFASGYIDTPSITTTNLTATGRVKIKGSDITLENGHISASGDMRATGSVYALTGSFGTGTTTITDSINTTGAITATGNIQGAALSAVSVQAEEIVARSGKTEITLGKVSERVTAIINGDIRVKGSDMFIGSGSISCSGEIHTTGSITAGGDVSAGSGCTGSFDHIVTLNNTIEFRDENNRNSVKGYLKFDDTYGLQALGSNQAQMLIQANKLKTARNIGGVSFNGTADINLPGVNTAGNQNTSGNAATSTKLAATKTIGGVAFDGSKNIIPKSHLGSNNTIRVFPTDFFYNRNIQYSPEVKWAHLKLVDGVDSAITYYNMQLPVGAQLSAITAFGTPTATISVRHIDRCGNWVIPAISFLYKGQAATQVPCNCEDVAEWTVNPSIKNNAYLQGVDNYLVIGLTFTSEKAQFASLTLTYM